MTIKEVVELIAKKEGKKSQVTIQNIREIVGILSDVLAEEDSYVMEDRAHTYASLVKNGNRRMKIKKPKKKKL